jgi:hypothetical protein
MGAQDARGYGRLRFGGRVVYAHRLAWELASGVPIPKEKHVIHSCGEMRCCNPRHLRLGTPKDNARDHREHTRERRYRTRKSLPRLKRSIDHQAQRLAAMRLKVRKAEERLDFDRRLYRELAG